MPYHIFGCKVNKFYINQWLNYYKTTNISLDNLLLIATCVVTDRAKNKWLKEAQKALKSWMNVAITGCGTLHKGRLISETDFFSVYPELAAYYQQIELLGEAPSLHKERSSEIAQFWWDTVWKGVYTKHFIVIQNGCDNYCSFCLTVMKRGQHRSRPVEDIIAEIQQIETQGGKEIVLTWINLCARGASTTRNPHESKFPELLEKIVKETTIPRIRISSIWPEYANDHFFEVLTDERILPHFHYAIQSFSDTVLQQMKRNYDAQHLKNILQRTRKLKRSQAELISLGADLIIGFPGESEADFLKTLQGVEEYGITKLHAFPFSDHHKGETIPASLYPQQVAQEVKKERESRLLTLGDKIRKEFIEKNVGTQHTVLIEEYRKGKWKGRTENYIQVELEGEYQKGQIISLAF